MSQVWAFWRSPVQLTVAAVRNPSAGADSGGCDAEVASSALATTGSLLWARAYSEQFSAK